MCVCVCERERERKKERAERGRERAKNDTRQRLVTKSDKERTKRRACVGETEGERPSPGM